MNLLKVTAESYFSTTMNNYFTNASCIRISFSFTFILFQKNWKKANA